MRSAMSACSLVEGLESTRQRKPYRTHGCMHGPLAGHFASWKASAIMPDLRQRLWSVSRIEKPVAKEAS
jgi:hypothetical protein